MLLALAVGSMTLAADDSTAPRGLWVIEYENDIFAGEDRYYTSGVRLSRIDTARTVPGWLESIAQRFPGFDDAKAMPYALSIAHNIYTPADITDPQFPPDDRPYAAWLHAKFSTGTLTRHGADRVRVGVGIVGPAALGKTIQTNAHRLIDSPRPIGWSQQLKNEPTLQLGYDRFRTLALVGANQPWGADLAGIGGINLGNAHTHPYAGGFVRLGYQLPRDFGPPRITPAASGSGYFEISDQRSFYVYAGWEGRRVVRDLFIEGNTIGGRDGVSKRRRVAEVYAGVVYTQGPLRLAYTHVWRTREFVGQISSHDYGAFSASIWW